MLRGRQKPERFDSPGVAMFNHARASIVIGYR